MIIIIGLQLDYSLSPIILKCYYIQVNKTARVMSEKKNAFIGGIVILVEILAGVGSVGGGRI